MGEGLCESVGRMPVWRRSRSMLSSTVGAIHLMPDAMGLCVPEWLRDGVAGSDRRTPHLVIDSPAWHGQLSDGQ